MFKYITLLLLLLLLLSTPIYAGNTDMLRVDNTSGPWFDTIDEDARDYAYTLDNFTFKGPTALRFELRDGDCFTAYPLAPESGWDDCTRDRERTEVRERWEAPLNTSVWYQIHIFIPNDYIPMYPKQMFWQWHNGIWGPNLYFHLNENKFHVDILTERDTTTTQYTFGTDILTTGQWHELTVNAVWSTDPQLGRILVYVNRQRIIEYYGPTLDRETYESGSGPHVKYGIYRSHLFRWLHDAPHPTHVLYFDEYRRGYNFQDVNVENYGGD